MLLSLTHTTSRQRATTRFGTLGKILSNHNLRFLKTKDSQAFFFFANRPITFIDLRLVETVLKFSTVAQLILEFNQSVCKTFENVFKKRCNCIIFFQVPRVEQSHCISQRYIVIFILDGERMVFAPAQFSYTTAMYIYCGSFSYRLVINLFLYISLSVELIKSKQLIATWKD